MNERCFLSVPFTGLTISAGMSSFKISRYKLLCQIGKTTLVSSLYTPKTRIWFKNKQTNKQRKKSDQCRPVCMYCTQTLHKYSIQLYSKLFKHVMKKNASWNAFLLAPLLNCPKVNTKMPQSIKQEAQAASPRVNPACLCNYTTRAMIMCFDAPDSMKHFNEKQKGL